MKYRQLDMPKVTGMRNMRILRFLFVLSAVILTIFIYASYSNSSLSPAPHMRTSGTPQAYISSHRQQIHNKSTDALNSSGESGVTSGSGVGSTNDKVKKSIASAAAAAKKQQQQHHTQQTHYRQPTIDEDAGVSANIGNGLDDVPDEVALERFANNDLLEEQYVQNVDNLAAGSNNNTVSGIATQSQQQLQAQQQQLQINQLNDINNNNNNNNNKILDSDVLIPTSNLQKFIENADKILKNITLTPPPSSAAVSASGGQINANEASLIKAEQQDQAAQQPLTSGVDGTNNIAVDGFDIDANAAEIDNEDEAANNVMLIPPKADVAPAAPPAPPAPAAPKVPPAPAAPKAAPKKPPPPKTPTPKKPVAAAKKTAPKAAAVKSKPKVTPKTNVTAGRAPQDYEKGIPTRVIYESGHLNEEINIDKLCPNNGADLKLLILITSAQAHYDARLAIRQTWGHYGVRRDVSTAFVLGRTTNETINKALREENFIYGDLIRGNFIDSYNNLTLKTLSTLEWIDEHCSRTKYVLKTDDDMFINVPKLLDFLNSHAKEKRVIYGRLARNWKPVRNNKSKYYVSRDQFSARTYPPFTTGPAYVFTSDIVHELYLRSLDQVYLKLEDVFTTGIVAQQLGIRRLHANEFLNRRIALHPCNIRKSISVHMIKSNEQFDLWKKLLEKTTTCK